MDTTTQAAPQPSRPRQTINLDMRLVVTVLLLVIAGMLLIWRPWSTSNAAADNRTISVTGEASLKAEPDEFVFSPAYTIQNADREAALTAMTRKSEEVTAKLKALGINDSQIKSNADSYDRGGITYPVEPGKPAEATPSYTLQLTVTVASRDQAQKVQDYLNTTTPTGAITPGASFSTAKRKELENKARDEATKDARAKADQSARNLGFKLGDVKTVADGSGFGGVMPLYERDTASDAVQASPPQLNVQPGENELSYSVTVEYFVK